MISFLDYLFNRVPGSVLKGSGIYLRPPRMADWKAWAKIRAESSAFLRPWEPTWHRDALSRAAFARRLRRHAADVREGAGYAFFIYRESDNELLGGITISDIRLGISRSCSVGYWIGKPHANQGYMSSALMCIALHVFDDLGLHRLEAACLPHNEPSRALLLKTGFKEVGHARQYLSINGKWQDHLLFSLLREDLQLVRKTS